jgi:hypothetical protein
MSSELEREAHRRVIELWFANWRDIGKVSPALELAIDSLEGMVDEALDVGFRRSSVSSSAEEREEIARIIDVHVIMPVSSRLAIARSLQGNGFHHAEVPEPSAGEDEFTPGECDGSGKCPAEMHVHGCYMPHRADQCDSPDEYGHLPAEPQGEPSDAQVLVEAIEKAISKLHWFPNNGVAEDLRAALRAAGVGGVR